jgi:PKD repeat protein
MSKSRLAAFVSSVLLGSFFSASLAAPAAAQSGHVVGAQKISDTAGGFDALLDEEDQFGRSIVNLGDMDGDGVSDLLVGAHTDDDGGLDQGSVYVLFLHANGFVKSWTKISAESGNFSGWLDLGDQFGRAAACVGDLDLDGVVDVVVSSNYDDDGGTNKGAIYVLFLSVDGTVKHVQKISQTEGGFPATLDLHDEFGRSITALGDMDGDGACDIVVGTPEDDDGGTNTGALHVLFLKRDGTVKSYRRISRSTDDLRLKPGDWFGHCTTNLGDFDHDGVTDIAVGSVLDDDGGFNQGSLWILLLNADGSVKSSHEINELVGGFTGQLDDIDQFGTSVANIGDLDGNGVTDLIVGAVKDDDGGLPGNDDADVGAAWVLFLEADATVKSCVKLSDTSGDLPYELDQYDWFGSAAARLGGSPGDGLFNVAIGCRNDDDGSPNRGAVYLVQLNDGTAPIADFTASKTLGVAPMTVAFSDTSTNEVTAWLWNFSEGNQSNLPGPTRTFAAPGTYTVTLTARGPRGRDVEKKIDYITVVAGPLADFSVTPGTGMAPLAVQFTDLSEGDVTSWSWDLGDGTSSSARSPSHVYATGIYTVALTVTGPDGTHTRTRAACVDAHDLAPVAAFDATPLVGLAPLDVQFSDHSGGLVTAWSWSFGDGASASLPSPQHTYLSPGTYQAVLGVSGPHGNDGATRTIVVHDPHPAADFAAEPTAGHAPLAVQFEDRSTGLISGYDWDFGDGEQSSETSPLHVYREPGTYSVRLSLTGPLGGDVETRTGMIVVSEPPPRAEFLASSTTGFAPFSAQFTDQSSGSVTSWWWSFGDGQTSSEPSPTHTWTAPGTYGVTLTVSGPGGSDTRALPDLVAVKSPVPVAAFDATLRSGLAPLAVHFADASQGNVTSWSWEFGDGATSSEREPEHIYLSAGAYDVRLTVTGSAGSDVELRPGWVVVAWPPASAEFAAAPTTGVAPLTVQFTDLSGGSVEAWSWSFGDGTSASTQHPHHVFTTPGTYTVSLTASGPAGSDTRSKPACVTVQWPAPVPEFTAGPVSGFAPLPVAFTDLSTGNVTSWLWNFGDGTTSRQRYPVKVFNRTGVFTVTLTAKGPGGSRAISHGGISVSPMPVLADGGFELDPVGAAPLAPWRVVAGTALVVRSSATPDTSFPREGALWCELGAQGSSAATPPSNPGGAGALPVGAAALERTVSFSSLAPHLVFDAAFLCGEALASPARNDFMSVDVSDGGTTRNLFLADTFSAFPAVSTLHGLPMTAVSRVQTDLRALFPGLAEGAPLVVRISVGNAGDGLNPSRGHLDSFRLVPVAMASFRNGLGSNAPRYVSSPAVLGGSWTIQVDTTGHAGVRSIQLVGMQRPASGVLRVPGEVLSSGKRLFAQSWPAVPGLNVRTIALPPDLALMGAFMSTQVTISGGTAELTNAYDLVLGF